MPKSLLKRVHYLYVSIYRSLDWYDAYELSCDMSVPNVALRNAAGVVLSFRFFVDQALEIPLTTSEDYLIFHILKEDSIALWKTADRSDSIEKWPDEFPGASGLLD